MKKITITILICILFITVKTVAQPTLTAASSTPVAGEIFTQHQIGYEDPGSAGANVSWDFSGVFSVQTMTSSYSLPSATPYASLYTSANLASTISGGGTTYYSYFNSSSGSYTLNGFEIPSQSASMPYSDPEKLLQYPCNFNTAYTDNFATTVSGYDRHGSISVIADAYGDIILPYGTISGVLRVKATETYSDYVSGTPVTNYTSVNYYWYKPGVHYCVFQLSTLYVGSSVYQQYGLYLDQSNVGITDNSISQNNFNCYPNPANDKVILEFPPMAKDYTISICNLNGSEVFKQQFSPFTLKSEINISTLSDGVYFVKLISDNKIEVRKIVKQ